MDGLELLYPGDIIRLETGMSIIANIPENVCNMDKPFSYKETKSIVEIGKIYRSKPFTQYEIKGMVQNYLKENEIGSIIHYPIPPHKQAAYKEWNNLSFPVTEKIHAEELSLPMSPTLTDEQVEYVIDVINAWSL